MYLEGLIYATIGNDIVLKTMTVYDINQMDHQRQLDEKHSSRPQKEEGIKQIDDVHTCEEDKETEEAECSSCERREERIKDLDVKVDHFLSGIFKNMCYDDLRKDILQLLVDVVIDNKPIPDWCK